jgi:hypothetical protein
VLKVEGDVEVSVRALQQLCRGTDPSAGEHKDGPRVGLTSCFDIAHEVAHEEGAAEQNAELTRRLKQQSWLWFSAFAAIDVCMGTNKESAYLSAITRDIDGHFVMNIRKVIRVKKAARNR